MAQAKKVLVYDRPGTPDDGMHVRPTHKLNLTEGAAVIKELLEDFRVLVQFDDPKVRPNFRELKPEEIGAKIITQEAPKPPLGLVPRFVWVSQRIDEIRTAIARFESAGHSVPRAWRSELLALQGSVFKPCDISSEDINAFTQKVQYQPAYSIEQINQMISDVLPFLADLEPIDVEVIDARLVNVSQNPNQVLTAEFTSEQKNFAYLCAFLLNNARNIMTRT